MSVDEELRTRRPHDYTGIPDPQTAEQHCPTWQHHIVKSRGGERKKDKMEKEKGGLTGRGLWEIRTGSIRVSLILKLNEFSHFKIRQNLLNL